MPDCPRAAVISQGQRPSFTLFQRRRTTLSLIVAIALANKLVRMAWAIAGAPTDCGTLFSLAAISCFDELSERRHSRKVDHGPPPKSGCGCRHNQQPACSSTSRSVCPMGCSCLTSLEEYLTRQGCSPEGVPHPSPRATSETSAVTDPPPTSTAVSSWVTGTGRLLPWR